MSKLRQIWTEADELYLPDEVAVWRYVPLKALFFYLAKRIFIPSVAKLREGDPFEGEFHSDTTWFNQAMLDRFPNNHEEIRNWIHDGLCTSEEREMILVNKSAEQYDYAPRVYQKHFLNFLRRTRFAWCWFAGNRESAAMWNTYGKDGAAVKSKIGTVKAMLEGTGRDFVFGKMKHFQIANGLSLGFNPEKDRHLLLEAHFLKRIEYASEQEVRFVTSGPEIERRSGIILENIKPSNWIDEIIFRPGVTRLEEDALRTAVQGFDKNITCRVSDLLRGKEQRAKEDLDWIDDLSTIVGSKWKNSDDGIPVGVKEVWKPD